MASAVPNPKVYSTITEITLETDNFWQLRTRLNLTMQAFVVRN